MLIFTFAGLMAGTLHDNAGKMTNSHILAALLGHCDFVHAVESAYVFCPFTT